MSILLKLNRLWNARWLAIVAVAALIPLAGGCTQLETQFMFLGLGYAHELLFTPARAMIGTSLLDFVNTH